MTWWIWVVFGLLLMTAEALTPGGFDALFLGLAAVVVGILTATGLIDPFWLQGGLYSVLVVGWLLVLRRPLRARFTGEAGTDVGHEMVGESAVALAAIAANGSGRVEVRGTPWMARNAGPLELAAQQRCRVVRVDGLTLFVEAE